MNAVDAIYFLGGCFLLGFSIKYLKALLISSTISISREVEHGEGAQIVISFYFWESQQKMFEKYQRLVGVAEMRKQFCAERFEGLLSAEHQRKQSLRAVDAQ